MSEGLGPRKAAVDLLDAVLGERQLLSQAVADPAGPLAGLDGAGRARAQRLAHSVLRQVEPVDAVLSPLLRKAPPLRVRNILRLAVVELAQGAAAHGVVNAAVSLAQRDRKTAAMKGMVNAVLRNLPAYALSTQKVQKLPRWLRQPLVHAWGREAVAAIEAVQAVPPPLDLTIRPDAAAPEGDRLPTGSLRLAEPGQVSVLPGYEAGGWWVQDAAAALAVPVLAPQAGERVLDLCAAPGGKTLQLAAAGARVTALDISAPRMERVVENLARCGLRAETVVADALDWMPPTLFDAILLDAPCSATGTIRRHPDLPFVKDGSEIPALVALQARLIDRAVAMLAPGGRLVFCTCSLLPDEGEAQLAAALARHPGLKSVVPQVPGMEPDWIAPGGGLRLRPDYWAARGGMDGFFMARLERR
ncbi:MAG: transcription antitermination factor NusB [Paracoccaceae bacterium]